MEKYLQAGVIKYGMRDECNLYVGCRSG